MISVQSQQVLIPKQVYIGDTAELLCSFFMESEALQGLTKNGSVDLSLENFETGLNSQEYEVKKVKLIPSGVNYYQLNITFVPWKTGDILFPAYNLEGVNLVFEPVNIVSITEKNSISTIKESTAPLLLPGTTYKLYALLLFSVSLLIVIIRLAIKHREVAFFIKNLRLKLKYKKSARLTKKALLELKEKSDITEKSFASEVQKIMRSYLEIRFAYPFTKTVTSDLMKGFTLASGNLLCEEKQEAFEEFVNVFVRTDYLRYSQEAKFENSEKSLLIDKLIMNIGIMEAPAAEKVNEKEEVEHV